MVYQGVRVVRYIGLQFCFCNGRLLVHSVAQSNINDSLFVFPDLQSLVEEPSRYHLLSCSEDSSSETEKEKCCCDETETRLCEESSNTKIPGMLHNNTLTNLQNEGQVLVPTIVAFTILLKRLINFFKRQVSAMSDVPCEQVPSSSRLI